VHISKLSKKFVKNPMDMISVGDIVEVWILDIDENKGKVSLTMVDPNE
ncbi:S1 RNA-binding domain-containing protein, partial [Staphylococcus intermedius]